MSSNDAIKSATGSAGEILPEIGRTLLDAASASIDHGLSEQRALSVNPQDYPVRLRQPQASFVTLRIDARLRGCMGSLDATEPLIVNVARNAYSAAFRDPRFSALSREEFPSLAIHLSLLSPAELLAFESEEHLLTLIRPGIDGLTLVDGSHRATLLPAVWKTVANPRDFLIQLKRKAGLVPDYWSPTLRVERYTTVSVGADE